MGFWSVAPFLKMLRPGCCARSRATPDRSWPRCVGDRHRLAALWRSLAEGHLLLLRRGPSQPLLPRTLAPLFLRVHGIRWGGSWQSVAAHPMVCALNLAWRHLVQPAPLPRRRQQPPGIARQIGSQSPLSSSGATRWRPNGCAALMGGSWVATGSPKAVHPAPSMVSFLARRGWSAAQSSWTPSSERRLS